MLRVCSDLCFSDENACCDCYLIKWLFGLASVPLTAVNGSEASAAQPRTGTPPAQIDNPNRLFVSLSGANLSRAPVMGTTATEAVNSIDRPRTADGPSDATVTSTGVIGGVTTEVVEGRINIPQAEGLVRLSTPTEQPSSSQHRAGEICQP